MGQDNSEISGVVGASVLTLVSSSTFPRPVCNSLQIEMSLILGAVTLAAHRSFLCAILFVGLDFPPIAIIQPATPITGPPLSLVCSFP